MEAKKKEREEEKAKQKKEKEKKLASEKPNEEEEQGADKGPELDGRWDMITTTWIKVFRSFPEFRILRLTFHRKSASKC